MSRIEIATLEASFVAVVTGGRAVRRRTAAVALLLSLGVSFALSADDHELLVTADWVARRAETDGVVLLHVDMQDASFQAGRVPGARFLAYGSIVANRPGNGGMLINEMPEAEAATEVFRAAGVSHDSHVVVYGHPVLAARAFVTLEQLGHRRVSILDGGVEAWRAAGHDVVTGPGDDSGSGDFVASPRDDVLVDAGWIDRNRSDESVAFIDSRPLQEYTGADGGRGNFRPGHIPGATHLYWEELISQETGRYLEESELRDRFATAGLQDGKTLVSYCAIGMRASVNYFAARRLGLAAKFYDGSMNDWSLTDFDLATGPDPSAPFSEVARRDENGWISLFDGFSMNGWKASENSDSWIVEDGALTCHGPRSHLFFVGADGEADNTFTDFELSVEVRTSPGSNSGIYFHTRYQDTGWPRQGFEAQVNQTHGDWKKSGSVYDVVNVREQLAEDGDWYTQTVRVEGKKITTTVNGKTAVEYTEPDDHPEVTDGFDRRITSGTFALQAHDPESKIQYRNLRVRRLD